MKFSLALGSLGVYFRIAAAKSLSEVGFVNCCPGRSLQNSMGNLNLALPAWTQNTVGNWRGLPVFLKWSYMCL